MNNHTVELILKTGFMRFRIFLNSIDTDENVPANAVFFRVVESYDVCVSIVIEVLDINL